MKWKVIAIGVVGFAAIGSSPAHPAERVQFESARYLAGPLHRIALLGFSQGAIAALSLIGARDFDLFEREADHKFKTAIAFYPSCPDDGAMTVPTLILIGDLDDWTPAVGCKRMMAGRTGAGSPVRLIVYPGAHHGFDVMALQPAREIFGHRLEYNGAAAQQAADEVRRFLAEQLGR